MATAHQRATTRRKLTYLGLILGLFVVNTFFWRGVNSRLVGTPAWTVTAQGNQLELREVNQGEAELSGSAIRLGLTGSRGLATTGLWIYAIEKQKRHEWNKLESVVQSLTKLQPHFLTPWLFQSWNLAYNVSVESDRVKDKYFYISRGIELLAQGERVNRNSPDMRFWTGFYFQMKFGTADEANTLRSLFQMSCIDPQERDPINLRLPDGGVDMEKFEAFCKKHSFLVRRLREKLRCNTPADVLDFLADNRRIPSQFYDPTLDGALFVGAAGQKKPADQQFPVLPPVASEFEPDQPTPVAVLGDDFDNYRCAHAWFAYAQDPLPPAEVMIMYRSRDEKLVDLAYGKRLPRQPAEVIFRQSPARSESYVAEKMQAEGWFDQAGWSPDEGRSGSFRWFPGKAVVIGDGKQWGETSWNAAFGKWQLLGRRTGMYLEQSEIIALQEKAQKFRDAYEVGADVPQFGGLRPEDANNPVMVEALAAQRQLLYYNQNREMTNFPHHYYRAATEKDPDMVQARKLLDVAERQRALGDTRKSLESYEAGLVAWTKLLERYPAFRADSTSQEDVVELEQNYLQLLEKFSGPQVMPAVAAADLAGWAAGVASAGGSPADAAWLGVRTTYRVLPFPVVGLLQKAAPNGAPWVDPSTTLMVRQRMGLDEPPPPPPVGVINGDTTPTPTPKR